MLLRWFFVVYNNDSLLWNQRIWHWHVEEVSIHLLVVDPLFYLKIRFHFLDRNNYPMNLKRKQITLSKVFLLNFLPKSMGFCRDFIGDVSKINFEFCWWLRLEVDDDCCIFLGDDDNDGGLRLCVTGEIPKAFGVSTTASILNRTAGGLNEFAKSELDEAIPAWRRRSIDIRRSVREREECFR